MKLAITIDIMLEEYDWVSRIAKCNELGINAIEFFDFRTHDPKMLRKILDLYGMTVIDFEGIAWKTAPEGTLMQYPITNPNNKDKFLMNLKQAVDYAAQIDTKNILICPGQESAGFSEREMWKSCTETLIEAIDIAEAQGITLLIEPLNRDDHPGQFLHSVSDTLRMIDQTGNRIKLLFDVFQMSKEEKDLIGALKRSKDYLGSVIHVADTPDRNEPGTGEIDWSEVMAVLKDIAYDGYICFEFVPSKQSEEAIKDARRVLGMTSKQSDESNLK